MIINEETAKLSKENTKWQVYAGVFMIIAGILVLFVQNTYVALMVIFVIVGIVEICLGMSKLRRIENFYIFKEIIGEKNEIRISDLAKLTQHDTQTVISDLQWMMQNGFFEDVEIDGQNEFFRSRSHYKWKMNTVSAKQERSWQQSEEEFDKQRKMYNKSTEQDLYYSEICDCCGGVTKIKVGGGGVCDYCGAPIGKYKRY